MTHILELQHLNKQFGGYYANNDVNLSIPQGCIYGLLGPNGAGKTTMIRMITTISKPDTGTILFRGNPLKESDAEKMGYMPEERGLYKKMNVISQLLFFGEIKGMSRKDAREAAKYWMNKLDISSWENKKMEELSKGMAQKIQFICTIIHRPKLIILDEPFSGFDPVNADLVKDLILELKAAGSTILFSTHRMDNVEELCDELCIIHKGKIVLNGPAGSLRREQFENIYEIGYLQETDVQHLGFDLYNQEQTPDGRFVYRFKLKPEENKNELLQKAIQQGALVHFTESLPSIHDIFVKTVSEVVA